MLDKIFEGLKIDSAKTNLVPEAGLTMPESLSSCHLSVSEPVSVSSGLILEKIYELSFCRDKLTCP